MKTRIRKLTPHRPRPGVRYGTVPKLWPESTIVCLGAGPSLTKADCDYVRGKARVIAINTSIELAPWADVLYACDKKWWRWAHDDPKRYPNFRRFTGLKYALTSESQRYPGVVVLRNTGSAGLELKPDGLKNGRNGGYQAINLAVHLGARRILLLGYDMQRSRGKEHWHGDHPTRTHSPYTQFRESYTTIVQPLKDAGIEVINCSRETALHAFPEMPLEDALPTVSEAVA